jgi:hypothetical protein
MTPPQLLQDILNHLATNTEARERLNSNKLIRCYGDDSYTRLIFYVKNHDWFENIFGYLHSTAKVLIIQTALSNTSDGVAVCSFLDVDSTKSFGVKIVDRRPQRRFEPLNHLLHTTFTTALFNGKPFETALEETNAVYLDEVN